MNTPRTDHPEVAHHLSAACAKTALAMWVLSAIALGLAQKFSEAPRYNAYAKYLQARSVLAAALADLQSGECWKTYTQIARDEGRQAGDSTLKKIENLKCNGKPSSPTLPGSIVPPLDARSLESSLKTLWDGKLLKFAVTYSLEANIDILKWDLACNHIAPSEAIGTDHEFMHMRIGDLNTLSATSRSDFEDVERALRDEFHTALPNSSIGVGVVTAAWMTAGSIACFATLFAAFFGSAIRTESIKYPSSVFRALFGTPLLEVFGCIMFLFPVAALFWLSYSIWPRVTVVPVAAFTAVTTCAIAWVLYRSRRYCRAYLIGRRIK